MRILQERAVEMRGSGLGGKGAVAARKRAGDTIGDAA